MAQVEPPLTAVDEALASIEQGNCCKALWAGVLLHLVKDALSYAQGQSVYGVSEMELHAAYVDVAEAGPMLRQVCGLLEIPPDYVQRVFRALAATTCQSDDMRNCGNDTAVPSAGSTTTTRIYGPLPLRAWSRAKFMA
jgi:hypothetical protein